MRALLERNSELSRSDPVRAHETSHSDAVLEFPQSGKRFVGVESFRGWRGRDDLGGLGVARAMALRALGCRR